MAEAVVSITLGTICNLLLEEAQFHSRVKSEVETIQHELLRMRSFLKEADSRQVSDERVRNCINEVREAAYDIEDNILVFVAAKAASRRSRNSKNPFKRITPFVNETLTTYRIGSRIATIRTKISNLTKSFQTYGISPVAYSGNGTTNLRRDIGLRRSYSHVVEEDFVGLEEDIKMLVAHLVDEHKDRVISIYGMGGLGKTTIARKVYGHRDVRRHFEVFAWICISQQCDKKEVLQGILIKLIPEKRSEIMSMRDEELVRQIHEFQLKKKCLVVLDDIWNNDDWRSLKDAFPNTRSGKGSKILLTTRNRDVAVLVDPNCFLYEPRELSNDESWELLRRKAFPRRGDVTAGSMIDPDMERLGKEMVVRCCGLPLAILVLGGLLITKHTYRDWQMVNDNINWYLARGRGQGHQAVNDVLAFSYHDLPYQFKQCFLYMANFPEDYEIEAEKLYQFWLAEGILSQDERAEEETMMDVAERYLAELAQRCLVQVNVKETAGGFKNCRLHDLMRDFCISQAKDENFTKIVNLRRERSLEPYPSNSATRRVSIYLDPRVPHHSSPSSFSDPYRVRSAFVYADDCKGALLLTKSHLAKCKLLRVLRLQGFNSIDVLPDAIGDLIHLRYLSLSYSQFKKLPLSLGQLIYLQTLDLEVTTLLEIPNVIYKMERLKHLYLPVKFRTGDDKSLRLDGLDDLETLVNFNTSLCDVKDLDTLTNLRKLRAAIKDRLDALPNIIKYISFTQNHLSRSSLSISCPEFCSAAELNQLRTLLSCHRLYKLTIEGRIAKLPEHYHFSPSIAKIAFKASELDEDPMATLEKLPKLSSLTLYDSTFVGENMVCLTNGFPRLLYLKLWGLSNLKTWRIDDGAMPKLTRLVIAHCEKLEILPDGLKSITTIQKLNVRSMSDKFKNRLRTVDGNIGEDFQKVRHIADIKLD